MPAALVAYASREWGSRSEMPNREAGRRLFGGMNEGPGTSKRLKNMVLT